jgi:ribosomal protein S18 acetylase RimI-like enzyme
MNRQAIRSVLITDPIWSAYALADMQPAFAPFAHWGLGHSAEGDGVVLFFTALDPPVLFAIGPAAAVADALRQLALPDTLYLTVLHEHLPLLSAGYIPSNGLHAMWRMAWRGGQTELPSAPGLARLQREDSEAIRQLYAHGGPFTPDAFDPYQFKDGVFFGVKDEHGALLAVGGTHIIDRPNRGAALGNIYTRPDCRGRGLAKSVTRAIVHTLSAEGVTNLILNVDQQNLAACSLYEQLGFVSHCPYIEATVARKVDRAGQ